MPLLTGSQSSLHLATLALGQRGGCDQAEEGYKVSSTERAALNQHSLLSGKHNGDLINCLLPVLRSQSVGASAEFEEISTKCPFSP